MIDGVSTYPLPADYNKHIADTFWKNYEGWRLYLINPQQAQGLQSTNLTELTGLDTYRISGWQNNQLKITPTPTNAEDGKTIAFRYYSRSWVRPQTYEMKVYSNGTKVWNNGNQYIRQSALIFGEAVITTPPTHTTGLQTDGINYWKFINEANTLIEADSDVPILDDYLIQLEVEWRMLKSHGFVYEDEKAYAMEYRDSIIANLTGTKSFNSLGYGTFDYYNHPNNVVVNL